MTNQQAPESLADPSPDQLRAIARTARNSSGSASDDCGPLAYVLHGWRAAAIAFRAQQAALVDAQQPAPSAAAFDEHGFRDWVLRNLPKGSIIRNGEWWADHLTALAKRSVKAAPQPSSTPQADSVTAPAGGGVAISEEPASAKFGRFPAGGNAIDAVRYAKKYGAREVPAYGSPGNPLLIYPDDLAHMLAAATTPPAQAADSVLEDAAREVLMEHSGCGSGTQVEMLTVKLNPGDKVVMLKGRITQGIDAERADLAQKEDK